MRGRSLRFSGDIPFDGVVPPLWRFFSHSWCCTTTRSWQPVIGSRREQHRAYDWASHIRLFVLKLLVSEESRGGRRPRNKSHFSRHSSSRRLLDSPSFSWVSRLRVRFTNFWKVFQHQSSFCIHCPQARTDCCCSFATKQASMHETLYRRLWRRASGIPSEFKARARTSNMPRDRISYEITPRAFSQ